MIVLISLLLGGISGGGTYILTHDGTLALIVGIIAAIFGCIILADDCG